MKELTPSKLMVMDKCEINGYVHLFTINICKEIESVCLDYVQRFQINPSNQEVEYFIHFAKQGVKVRLK